MRDAVPAAPAAQAAEPPRAPGSPRVAALVQQLSLRPHPEGGWYGEVFRSAQAVPTPRGLRAALTTIDFVLERGQFSAWHRVRSDEVWHLLEGDGLRLVLMPPDASRVEVHTLGRDGTPPRCVVPADWWQAAEPLGDHAWCGATVGPGFDFADFAFGRDEPGLRERLGDWARLL